MFIFKHMLCTNLKGSVEHVKDNLKGSVELV